MRADLLLAPHHGSHTSSSAEFVAAVAPATTVFTVGYLNRFGHPRADVAARYADAGSRVLRTDRSGAIVFTLGETGLQAEAYRDSHARYWQTY